jgi:hypothetical protein
MFLNVIFLTLNYLSSMYLCIIYVCMCLSVCHLCTYISSMYLSLSIYLFIYLPVSLSVICLSNSHTFFYSYHLPFCLSSIYLTCSPYLSLVIFFELKPTLSDNKSHHSSFLVTAYTEYVFLPLDFHLLCVLVSKVSCRQDISGSYCFS